MIVITKTEEVYPDQTVENEAKYVLPDDYTVQLLPDEVRIIRDMNHPDHYDSIADMNSENAVVYTGITNVPGDRRGNNYCFDGTNWTPNPEFA